jgi:hypothetical protein
MRDGAQIAPRSRGAENDFRNGSPFESIGADTDRSRRT